MSMEVTLDLNSEVPAKELPGFDSVVIKNLKDINTKQFEEENVM